MKVSQNFESDHRTTGMIACWNNILCSSHTFKASLKTMWKSIKYYSCDHNTLKLSTVSRCGDHILSKLAKLLLISKPISQSISPPATSYITVGKIKPRSNLKGGISPSIMHLIPTSTSKVLRSCSSQVVNERFKKLDLAFNNVKPKDLYFVLD